uniref:Predicted protein n=1 Tax=Hordeum vulgare subsp. vulgare TaxID=112509 RepID=F2DST1_HORVV|nr:predicted protein [Hordeum vulgare subsp. vulgare]
MKEKKVYQVILVTDSPDPPEARRKLVQVCYRWEDLLPVLESLKGKDKL